VNSTGLHRIEAVAVAQVPLERFTVSNKKATLFYLPHVISVGLGFAATLIGYFLPTVFASNTAEQVRTILALSFGLYSFFISERFFISSTIEDVRDELLGAINRRVKIQSFETHVEALRYVEDNARRCKRIYNTRLRGDAASVERSHLRDELKRHDSAILDAIRGGCEYHFVIDKSADDNWGQFSHLDPVGAQKLKGKFLPRKIDTQDQPVLQMILLDYRNDRRDALIGWELGGQDTVNCPVVLFQDTKDGPAWIFFHELFEEYERQSTPLTGSRVAR
jgi:hypothetical protein